MIEPPVTTRTAITHRLVWALAGPMILSNISVPLVGAVDTAVVGRLPGAEYIGGVAIGALIFSFLYWGFSFLRMATSGYVARALGAGDIETISNTLLRVTFLSLLFGLVIILLGAPLTGFALGMIDSSAPVETLARDYTAIRIWSAPATLFLYVCNGALIGLHSTRQVFVLQLFLNSCNVLLDLLFVPVLGFGVEGVAFATLISEYLAAILGIWLLRGAFTTALHQPVWAKIFSLPLMLDLMRTNSHIFVRTLCLVFSFALFTVQGAKLGDLILAANAILLHLQSIMAYGLDGFASAAEALAGSAYGANNRKRFRQAVMITTIWATAFAAVIGLIYLQFGDVIISLFSNQQDVIVTALLFLPWMIASPVVSVWSYQLDGIFIGVGHTREMRNAMLVSTICYLLLIWIFLPWLGNHGLFLALTLFMVMRALTLWFYFGGINQAINTNSDQQVNGTSRQ